MPNGNGNRNRSSRVSRILKKTKLIYISLGLSAAAAANLVALTVQKVQRNANARTKYIRNLENYNKFCGYTGKSWSAPKGYVCAKPVPPGGVPKGFFRHLNDVLLASKYLIITLMICAMIGAVSVAYLKIQQSRLVGVARERAKSETQLAKRSGETTVRTAENLEEVTRECIAGAKHLIKAMNQINRDIAAAALNNSPNKATKIANLKDSKKMLEEELGPAMALVSASGRAQQFFLNTLTSDERSTYNERLDRFIMNSGVLAIQTANQMQQSGVVATTGRALTAAKNTAKQIAAAGATGGASLLLPSRQRAKTPRQSNQRTRSLAIQAPRQASVQRRNNSNKVLNNLLKQFN